jgi:hypothetical protein
MDFFSEPSKLLGMKLTSTLLASVIFCAPLTSPASGAAEADVQYKFNAASPCELSKKVDRKWKKANPEEIANVEPFRLHPVHDQANDSLFYANKGVYSAPTKCFTPVSELAAPVAETATAKSEPVHGEVESHDLKETASGEKAEEKAEAEHEEEVESEFLHQTGKSVFEVTPSLGYLTTHASYRNLDTTTSKLNGVVAATVAEYGITKNISVGTAWVYDHFSKSTTSSTNASSTRSGFEDPKFFANGKVEFGTSAIRLNLLFDTPLVHRSVQTNGDTNEAGGGFIFTPALGYEFHSGNNIFGAQVAYDLVKSDAKKDVYSNGNTFSTVTIQGGRAFVSSLFFERRFKRGEFGLSFQYLKANHTTEDGVDSNNGGSALIGTLYGEIEFGDRISILPSVSYTKFNFIEEEDNNNIDSVYEFGASVGGRFKF